MTTKQNHQQQDGAPTTVEVRTRKRITELEAQLEETLTSARYLQFTINELYSLLGETSPMVQAAQAQQQEVEADENS